VLLMLLVLLVLLLQWQQQLRLLEGEAAQAHGQAAWVQVGRQLGADTTWQGPTRQAHTWHQPWLACQAAWAHTSQGWRWQGARRQAHQSPRGCHPYPWRPAVGCCMGAWVGVVEAWHGDPHGPHVGGHPPSAHHGWHAWWRRCVLVEGRHGLRWGLQRAHHPLHHRQLLLRLVLLHELHLELVDGRRRGGSCMHLLIQVVHALLQGLPLAPRLC
jgi:hypothetical protein